MRWIRRGVVAVVVLALGVVGAALVGLADAKPKPKPVVAKAFTSSRLTEKWRVALPYEIVGLPAADEAGVVVTAGEAEVVAISPTGKLEWTTAVEGALVRAPRLDHD